MINGPGAAKIAEALFDHFGGLAALGLGLGSFRAGQRYNCLFAA
jgi:hypothetical protein